MKILSRVEIPRLASFEGMENKKNEQNFSFKNIFTQVINDVNALQKESERLSSMLALGQVEDVHQVTIATEKASLALQLTVEIRNKLVDAYHEIMRMQL
ncbi:MAG: flagellar hook-basal body complex protein FliE [Thermoanaerobacteraceae bacterium]|jgi:flagellar hook-basal body complex protein FliE|nr:flagellar hook-basal body complex protein FliE [Thermoanaerobacteraceae bacterium]HHV71200.1 flagellar hook-basal body complex protein FliE [Clostridia bacterium]